MPSYYQAHGDNQTYDRRRCFFIASPVSFAAKLTRWRLSPALQSSRNLRQRWHSDFRQRMQPGVAIVQRAIHYERARQWFGPVLWPLLAALRTFDLIGD